MVALALAVAIGTPRVAWAQEPSAADKETARALLIDGRAKMQAKDYEGALKSLKAAHAIMHVPTTGLDYALALEATGQLVEARTLSLDISRIPEKPGEPEAFHDARTRAAEFATKLEARIPAVVVTLKGLPPNVEPTVTIDGAAVPAAALGLPRKVNPGAHVLKVTAPGFFPVQKKFELKESAPPAPLEVALVSNGQASGPSPGGETPAPAPKPVPAWAWAAGGIGLVGLGVGIGFGADYAKVKSKVGSDCPSNACTPTNFTAANALKSQWNRDVGVMAGGLAVGVVGVSVAVAGIVRSRRVERATTGFAPWVMPGAGGFAATGAF
jgi:hypothetical protein